MDTTAPLIVVKGVRRVRKIAFSAKCAIVLCEMMLRSMGKYLNKAQ